MLGMEYGWPGRTRGQDQAAIAGLTRASRTLGRFGGVGKVPVGEAVALCGDDEAEPFEAFEVGGNGVEFFLGGAEPVAVIV